MYYAKSDTFTGDNPKEATEGFANTKCIIAFEKKKERDDWVNETNLLTAVALTRAEALKESEWSIWSSDKRYDRVKECKIYGTNKYHTILGKNY